MASSASNWKPAPFVPKRPFVHFGVRRLGWSNGPGDIKPRHPHPDEFQAGGRVYPSKRVMDHYRNIGITHEGNAGSFMGRLGSLYVRQGGRHFTKWADVPDNAELGVFGSTMGYGKSVKVQSRAGAMAAMMKMLPKMRRGAVRYRKAEETGMLKRLYDIGSKPRMPKLTVKKKTKFDKDFLGGMGVKPVTPPRILHG